MQIRNININTYNNNNNNNNASDLTHDMQVLISIITLASLTH